MRIDETGIAVKFSNIVEEGGIKYRVDFSKRANVENIEFKLNPKGKIREASGGKYYFCVPKGKNGKNKKRDIETKYLYYPATMLENDALTVANTEDQ